MNITSRFVSALAIPLAFYGVLPTRASAAQGADTPLAVLGIEASDGTPEAIAIALTEALRQRVSSTKGFRLVPGRDLMEVKLVFSCPDEAPSCMAQAAKSLGAAKLIFGSVKKTGADNFLVTLKLLDAGRGMVDGWAGEPITRAQASGPSIRGPVQKWFADLTGQGASGSIRIRGDVIGASVSLDGVPSGMIGTDDLVLAGVSTGSHEILVTKPGYAPIKKEVTVSNGQTTPVAVALGSGTPQGEAVAGAKADGTPGSDIEVRERLAADPGRSTGVRAATWGVLGASAISFVLAVKFGIDVQKTNDNLDPYRRYKTGCNPGVKLCDRTKDAAPPLTVSEQKYVDAERAQGDKFQTYQHIAYGAGAALLVTSGILFYKGYLSGGGETSSNDSGVSVTPMAWADGGGLRLGLRF
jgi:hypothetical protein